MQSEVWQQKIWGLERCALKFQSMIQSPYSICALIIVVSKDGRPKDNFERGVALLARQTLFAEGARGMKFRYY